MNSLNSIQGINNKTFIIAFVPPVVTILNPNFSTPALSNNTTQRYIYSGTNNVSLYSWNFAFSGNSNGNSADFWNNSPQQPSYSTSIPQYIFLNNGSNIDSIVMSQTVYIPSAGTYQLSFYAVPFNTSITVNLSASIAGYNLQCYTEGQSNYPTNWATYSLNFSVSSAGNQTISINSYTTDTKGTRTNGNSGVASCVTGITITYLHS